MELAIIGLGKMGGNMARRLARAGHHVIGFNRTFRTAQELEAEEQGVTAVETLEAVVAQLTAPRVVWLMVPAGKPTEETFQHLLSLVETGDILIDGGNSNYKDTLRRSVAASDLGVHFIDVGTSGGIWGLKEGYSMMIGGEQIAFEYLSPIFEALAPGKTQGWGRVGPSGSGHFVKMVHNGIEYGMMQAYAEGFEILKTKQEFELDLHQISEIWRFGSVVRSWLLDLAADGLEADPELSLIKDWVADSGEGRWTVFEAIDLDVPAPVITLALQMRFISRQEESFAAKILAMLRNQFGGHAVKGAGN
jgi:6-phosphogluconate dehydrogenase